MDKCEASRAVSLDQIAGLLFGAAFGSRTLDGSKSTVARIGYGLVGYDLVVNALRGGPLLGPTGAQRTGLVQLPSNRTTPKFEERRARTIAERVAFVHEQAAKGTRDPQIYQLAREILSRKCGNDFCVSEKDHWGEAVALFNEVKRLRG